MTASCLVPSLSMYSSPLPGRAAFFLWASHTALYCTLHTLSTSGMSLLNSSKHPQDPLAARPLKMSPMVL